MTTNNVIAFKPKNGFDPKFIPLPKNARYSDRFDEFELGDNHLAEIGIFKGDLLTCLTTFKTADITPRSICILEIDKVQFASRIEIDESEFFVKVLTPKGGLEPKTYTIDELEILALAVEWRRAI